MWIFSKKTIEQPAAAAVPPELQQYYGQPTIGSRLRGVGLFILPVLAFLLVAAALISGVLWLRQHKLSDIPRALPRQTSRIQVPAKPNPQPSTQQASPPAEQSANQPTTSSVPATENGQVIPATGSQSNTGSDVASTSVPNQPTTIPDTGPSPAGLIAAIIASIVAAAGFHVRQIRRLRASD